MRSLTAYDLKSFYNGANGLMIRKLIRQKIGELWPDVKNLSLMGYGYALPYLHPYKNHASNIYAIMPAQLGVHNWPANGQNIVCLSEENALPLETNSVDRILMIHGMEFLDFTESTFEELWRVLKSSGRIMIVVPNRMGLWARTDWNPFGHGKPYSSGQVESFLKDNLFVHERTTYALFSPPFRNSILMKFAHIYEKVGAYLYPALGGVTIIEASKQLYAGRGTTAKAKQKNLINKAVTAKPVATSLTSPSKAK